MNYNLVELDNRAQIYIESILSVGKELSHIILDYINLSDGRVFAILPTSYTTNDNLYDFTSGGKVINIPPDKTITLSKHYSQTPISNTNESLVEVINCFLNGTDKGICVFEHVLEQATDPIVSNKVREQKYPILTLGNSVYYYFLSAMKIDPQTIQDTVRICNSIWHFVCVLATNDFHANGKGEISIDTLAEVISNAQGIIIGAYDGESYLIWSKDSSFLRALQ